MRAEQTRQQGTLGTMRSQRACLCLLLSAAPRSHLFLNASPPSYGCFRPSGTCPCFGGTAPALPSDITMLPRGINRAPGTAVRVCRCSVEDPIDHRSALAYLVLYIYDFELASAATIIARLMSTVSFRWHPYAACGNCKHATCNAVIDRLSSTSS